MNNYSSIVLGVIGCGFIGKYHVKNIVKNYPHVQLKYISDVQIDDTKKWARSQILSDSIIFTPDFEDILSDEDVNTVLIFTPITKHIDPLIKSAKAGKNIFIEKQIGLDPGKVKLAIDIVSRAKKKLQVGFMRRFDKNYLKARDMIQEGAIGDIHIVRLTSRNPVVTHPKFIRAYLTEGIFAGTFQELTCHDFDILRFITGSEIEELYSVGKVLTEPKLKELNDYDTIIVSIKFDNDSIGTIDNSYLNSTYGYDQRVEVFGSKGCILVNNVTPTEVTLYNRRGGTTDKLADKMWPDLPLFYMERYHEAFIKEFEGFFNSIINNTQPECTGIDGLKNIIIADAAKKSADTNLPVKIDYSICI